MPNTNDAMARRNVLVLAFAGALGGANSVVLFSIAAIVGSGLAPKASLATLPVSIYVVGLASAALPLGYMVARFGRRTTYMIATLAGATAGLINAAAIILASFELFCIGAFFVGFYASAVQSYRFAAADTASEAFRPKAISYVLAGGLVAGIVGPQLVVYTKSLYMPYLFAATCLAQAAVAVIACLAVSLLQVPPPSRIAGGEVRPLSEIIRQPRLIIAIVCGVASYTLMNFIMTAAPLAMIGCDHTVDDAAHGIQWHVIAMFGPSFFTGSLIVRFGVERIIATGLAITMASGLVALSGTTVAHFWIALILLGLGWNFAYIGASTMVTECHRPSERAKVQSLNDFSVYSFMALGSFGSGAILAAWGWASVNMMIFPISAVALLALVLAQRYRPVSL